MQSIKAFIRSLSVSKQAYVNEEVIGTPYIFNEYWSMIRSGSTKNIVDSFQKGELDCRRIIVEPSGHTVLHQAVVLNRRELFRLCESFGTDYDKPDHNGVTALMKASALELLAHGANKDLKDKKGRTALDYAYYYGRDICVIALKGGDISLSAILKPKDDDDDIDD